MAKVLYNRLQCHYGPVQFDIEIRGGITSITGDSGTGKTFLLQALKRKGSGYDVLPITGDFSTTEIELLISNASNKLIVVDNADIVLPKTRFTDLDFLADKKNQYLLFSRQGKNYGADATTIGDLIVRDGKVTIEYLR